MATIQTFYFTKNNSANFDCKAQPTDQLRCEAIVTFSGAEIGKRYWVNWFIRQPNGQDRGAFSEYATATSTVTFYMNNPLSNLVPGTYTILRVQLSQG